MNDLVRIERRDRVAEIVFGKPPLNILDLDLLAELDIAFESLSGDATLQLVTVRGAGEKSFSAGVSVQDHTPDKIDRMLLSFHGGIAKLRALEAFTVALVDGHCLGGGMELAMACDYVVATERSRFGQPEIALGCFPPVAAALYPRRVGSGRTLELLLTGRTFGADEAERLGFVDERLSDVTTLLARAGVLEATITRQSAAVSRLTKRAVRAGELRSYPAAIAEAERLYLHDLVRMGDMKEGLDAFLEKRSPDWKHR